MSRTLLTGTAARVTDSVERGMVSLKDRPLPKGRDRAAERADRRRAAQGTPAAKPE